MTIKLPLKIALDRLAGRIGKPVVAQVLKNAAKPLGAPKATTGSAGRKVGA